MTKLELNVREIADFINEYVKSNKDEVMTTAQIKQLLSENGIEQDIMFQPPDYSYNRTNKGLPEFANGVHIFEYVKRGTYRLLGENYPYSGPVKTKPQGQQNTYVVGYWNDGSLEIWKDNLWVDEREFDVPNTAYQNSQYVFVKKLKGKNNVELIKNNDDGLHYVRKVYSVYNKEVFAALSRTRIEGLPSIIDIQERDSKLYTIESYVEGETLQDLMDKKGILSEAEVKRIAIELCEILKKMHAIEPMIIHRDLKPSNIILGKDGKVYLIDFNASKEFHDNTSEDTVWFGTKYFAAPEQLGFGTSSAATDVFGMGATMSYLLTGMPYSQLIAPGNFGGIISKCVELESKNRYHSIDELEDAIVSLRL